MVQAVLGAPVVWKTIATTAIYVTKLVIIN